MSFRGNRCHKLVLGTAGASQLLQDRSGHEEGIAFRVYAIVRDATPKKRTPGDSEDEEADDRAARIRAEKNPVKRVLFSNFIIQ